MSMFLCFCYIVSLFFRFVSVISTSVVDLGNDCLSNVSPTSLPKNDDAYTITAWVKPATHTSPQNPIISWGAGSENRRRTRLYLKYDGVSPQITDNWKSFVLSATVSDLSSDNAWHYLVSSYDQTTRRIYLDGAQVASETTSKQKRVNNLGTLRVGCSSNHRFQGFLGEVTVWSVALSASQIELFYRFPYTTDGTESGLVSAWKFHEESSSIIYDLNSINDLALSGATHY